MLKTMKKAMAVILGLSCVINFTPATSIIAEDNYHIITVSGKEIRVSDELPIAQEKELIELYKEIPTLIPEGIVVGVDTVTSEIKDVEENATRAVIPTSTLSVSMVKSDISTSTQKKYKISSAAIWHSSPLIKNTDTFAVSWGKDFTLVSKSSTGYWKSGSATTSVGTQLLDSIPNSGVAYVYRAGNADSSFSWDPWYVQVDVVIQHVPSASGNDSANVVAKYAHKIVNTTANIGAGIGKGGDYSGSINFDTDIKHDTSEPASLVIYY